MEHTSKYVLESFVQLPDIVIIQGDIVFVNASKCSKECKHKQVILLVATNKWLCKTCLAVQTLIRV